MTEHAEANRAPRPILALVCGPTDAPFADDLCQATGQALMEASTGYVLSLRKTLDSVPARPNDVTVVLNLLDWGAIHLKAQLEWRRGAQASFQRGDVLETTVMDSAITVQILKRISKRLLSVTPELAAQLR